MGSGALISPTPVRKYLLHVESPQKVGAGDKASSRIVLEAAAPYHINKEFPLEVVVDAKDLSVPKKTLTIADAQFKSDREAAFEIPFSATGVGEKRFSATMRFAVCTDKDCYPLRDTLAWSVQVVEAGKAKPKR